MATKEDFTEEEWKAMQKGVTGAGFLVSAGDRDFTDSFGEAGALAKYLAGQRETSESELIRELANVRRSGFRTDGLRPGGTGRDVAALGDALATLAAKAPDEISAYRRLVLDAAEAVAEAKGGVKPGETAALEAIKEALGPA